MQLLQQRMRASLPIRQLQKSPFRGKLEWLLEGLFVRAGIFLVGVACVFTGGRALAVEIEYPQVIHTHYEAVDQKAGGHFVLWSEREKIFYGLDPKLFPGARYVDITQVTPTVGSITLTYVEVRTVANATSDYFYLTGNVRFRVSGMTLQSSNFPAGSGMAPAKP